MTDSYEFYVVLFNISEHKENLNKNVSQFPQKYLIQQIK